MEGGHCVLWVVIALIAPSYSQELECAIGNVNESVDFSQAEFQSGVYLLGEIPTRGSVKSLCAFGTIQVENSSIITKENEISIRGRIRIYIAREVSTGSTIVMDPYPIFQSWESSETVCVSIAEPVPVIKSDRVYVHIQKQCHNNLICPLQVNYMSDEQVLHSSVRHLKDALMKVRNGTLNLVSLKMTSLNVRVIIEAALPNSTFKALRVSVPIAVVAFLVFSVVVLLLVIAFRYKTIKKKNNAPLAISNPHHNGTDQEFEVVESGFSEECHSLEHSRRYDTAYSAYSMLSKEGSVETDVLPTLEEHDYEELYFEPANEVEELLDQLRKLSIPVLKDKTEIRLLQLLGSGAFGNVYQGLWNHCEAEAALGKDKLVAIKTIEEEASKEDRIKFLQEAAIMGQFNHPNIIRLLGIITTVEGHPKLIIELMGKGDLRKHLNQMKPGEGEAVALELAPTLLSYSRQIANGMMYLAVKSFVHRDLAARNILVSEDCVCKIADFGLSRDLQDRNFYTSHGGKIPVKWTAPEALHYHKYSTASDVWSYGCVLYEIWSLGFKPFYSDANAKVVKKVSAGFRLPPPPGCPRAIYHIMIQCWHPEAEERPAFVNIMIPLQKPDFQVLKWSDEDTQSSSKTARTLGSPLEAGLGLYKDLQRTYFAAHKPENKRDAKTTTAAETNSDEQKEDDSKTFTERNKEYEKSTAFELYNILAYEASMPVTDEEEDSSKVEIALEGDNKNLSPLPPGDSDNSDGYA